MTKRILAWVLLVGFVLLIMNLFLFHFAQEASFAIYIILVLFVLFSNKTKARENSKGEEDEGHKEDKGSLGD